VEWWGKCTFLFLCLAIALLGVGRVEIPLLDLSFSARSVSRNTFVLWLLWKLLLWIRHGRDGLVWQREMVPLPLLFFVAFVTFSLFPFFRESRDYSYFILSVIHYMIVVDVFSQGHRPRILLCILGIAPGFLFIRGVLADPSVLSLESMMRLGYPLKHPNITGFLYSMTIPVSLAVIFNEKRWLRRLGGLSLGAQLLGLIFTYSRGAWLGWAASMLFLGISVKEYKKALLVLLLGLAILLTIPPLRNRLLSLTNPLEDLAINFRIIFIKEAITVGIENPILGVGYNRYKQIEALEELHSRTPDIKIPIPNHAHNAYADLFAKTGLLGLGAFLWLLSEALYRILRIANKEQEERTRLVQIGIASALIAFIVTGLGEVPFHHHETRLYFFTLLALIYLYLRAGQSSQRL